MEAAVMKSASFERFAGLLAILAAISSFLYSVSFIVIARSNPQLGGLLSALFLMTGGLLGSAVVVALYERLRATDESFALWVLVLGVIGAAGSAIHGGYDLANAINVPESNAAALGNLPSQVDPRGLLTFGIAGLSILIASGLIVRGGQFPHNLGLLGYLLGFLFIVIYLARLIILDPTNPLVVATVLPTGFVLNPLWYLWLGFTLRRGEDK
jgi:hypothetical protein